MNEPSVGDGGDCRAYLPPFETTSSQHSGGFLAPTSAFGKIPLASKSCTACAAVSTLAWGRSPLTPCNDFTNSAIDVQPYIANRSGFAPLLCFAYHWSNSATSGTVAASSPWNAANGCGICTPTLSSRPMAFCCGTL